MPLPKTTIYPDYDADPILNQQILKFIVLGNYPDIVQAADDYADGMYPTERHVIWYKTIPVNLHQKFQGLPIDISNIKAFSCTITNKVAHLILKSEDVDDLRILLAYADADL